MSAAIEITIPMLSPQAHLRNKNVKKSAVFGLILRSTNIIFTLLAIPILVKYLGVERFGIWSTLTGLSAFISFADMGLGIGLQNSLSACYGKDDKETPRKYVSSALLPLLALITSLCLIAIYVLPMLDLSRIIKVADGTLVAELVPAAQAFILVFAAGLGSTFFERILIAFQKGYVSNFWLTVGRCVGFFGLVAATQFKAGMPFLIFIFAGSPFLAQIIGGIRAFTKEPWLRPSISAFSSKALKEISSVGFTGLGAQTSYTILQNSPPLILANLFGAASVAAYSVSQKLCGMPLLLLSAFFQPLWPAYREAFMRGDHEWIRTTFRKSLLRAGGACVLYFLIITVLGKPILAIWIGDKTIVPTTALLMACNVWVLLLAWNSVASAFLNAFNHMAGQALYGNFFAVLAIIFALTPLAYANPAVPIWVLLLAGVLPRSIGMLIEVLHIFNSKLKTPSAACLCPRS